MTQSAFIVLALVLVLMSRCEATFHDSSSNSESSTLNSRRALQTTCISSDDCDSGEYCNRGVCRTGGYCEDTIDCKNPLNAYSMIECLGFLYCDDNNECMVECAGSHCENYDEVDCSASPACEMTECSEDYVSCVNDDCGGCNSYFFTLTGEQACVFESNSAVESDCSSDADCSDSTYCMNGECAELGTCEEAIDCLNPSNTYPDTDCIGYTNCTLNKCVKICSANECPSDDNVQCYAPPCEVTTCLEEAVSCVDYTCGECTGIFFNSTGGRVCEADRPNGGCGKMAKCEQTNTWELSLCKAKVFVRTMTCPFLRN